MLPNVLAKFQNSIKARQREANEINISEWKTDRDEEDGNLVPNVWENRRPIGELMPEGCRSVQFIRFPQKGDYCFWICKPPSLKRDGRTLIQTYFYSNTYRPEIDLVV